MDILVTERLVIRPFVGADVEGIYQLVYADPQVKNRWSNYAGTLEEFREHFRTGENWCAQEDGAGFHVVVREADDSLLGLMGFQIHTTEDADWLVLPDGYPPVAYDPARPDAELTYAFGRAYWGEGYAAEVGRAMVAHGFDVLGIGRIINAVSRANLRTQSLMLRLGFRLLDSSDPESVIGMLESPDS